MRDALGSTVSETTARGTGELATRAQSAATNETIQPTAVASTTKVLASANHVGP
jgi:hypothetical protein